MILYLYLQKLKKAVTTEKYIGYAYFNQPEEVKFYITKPVNGEPATIGNGSQVTFLAKSRDAVDKFYKIAISKGAIDEGSHGVRSDGNYYAYVRDIDGNKIAAKCISNYIRIKNEKINMSLWSCRSRS